MKKYFCHPLLVQLFLVPAALLLALGVGNAASLDIFASNGWSQFADDDGVGNNGYVGPGYGGQLFDAEYLFYRLDGDILWLGLQTGFDLEDGMVAYSGVNYWTGDLALSFDGEASAYEYAVDFGLQTKTYYQNDLGTDPAGLYVVSSWNNGVYPGYIASCPLAMEAGSQVGDLGANQAGHGNAGGATSFYRIVSFDLADIGIVAAEGFTLDAHWTMSCGNDVVAGRVSSTPVPEPAALLLLGTGLAGLAGLRSRKQLRT